MSNTSVSIPLHPVVVALNAVDEAVESVQEASAWALTDCELETAIGECERLAARQAELRLRLIAEADGRDLGRRQGASSTPAWLRDRFRLRPADAKWQLNVANRIAAATDSGPVDYAANVNGPPTGREMPATGAALAAGEISEQHAVVVAKAMAKLPTTLAPEAAAEAERQLATYARQFDPAALAKLADCLVDALLPDTLEDDEEDAVNKRELRFSDLTGRLSGRLDPEGLALVRAMLDPLAAPRPTADGEKDDRSPARRLADALVEIARRVLNQGEWLPAEHGNRPHLMLISEFGTDGGEGGGADRVRRTEGGDRGDGADGSGDADAATNSDGAAAADSGANDRAAPGVPAPPAGVGSAEVSPEPARLAGHLGRGELTWGRPLSAASVRRIACDAGITWVITDSAGVPIRVGREQRTVTSGQWAALVARDGGCVFPGCTRPVEWCEAHHILWWRYGGRTDLENLCLLCADHHRAVHHRGWDIQLGADKRPDFLPPPWVDPDRTPRRNNRPRYFRNKGP